MSSKRFGNVCPSSSSDDDDAKFPEKYETFAGYRNNFEDLSRKRKASMTSNSSEDPRGRARGRTARRPCPNRNAIMARENRQRKKEYLLKLEKKLSFYQQENKSLANVIRRQGIDVTRLNGEVAYLRSVLNNNTSIAALLRTMNQGLARSAGNCETTEILLRKSCEGSGIAWRRKGTFVTERADGENRVLGGKRERYVGKSVAAEERLGKHSVSMDSDGSENYSSGKKTVGQFSDSDHTYTMIKRESNGNLAEMKSESVAGDKDVGEGCCTEMLRGVETRSASSEDRNGGGGEDEKSYEDDLPITPMSMTNFDDKLDLDMSKLEYDELSRMNINIFDNLTSLDDISSPLDDLDNAPNLFSDGNLFEGLGDTGICLHVNSGKVSLEFCTVCRMNSLNSEAE